MMPEMSTELRLASSDSLRLFCEGVHALDAYDRTASAASLELAIDRLNECVTTYPQDLLPRFYLGVAKSLTSYPGLDEALDHFRVVEASNVDALRLVTKYNRATTLIAHYTEERFKEAEKLLQLVLNEARQIAAHDRDQVQPLLFRAWVKQLFIRVRQTLWFHRRRLSLETHGAAADVCRADLDQFEREFLLAGSIEGADDIWAFHWNNEGIYEESLAYLYSQTDSQIGAEHANKAAEQFRKSISHKVGWPNALANLARVYIDLLNMPDEGIAICKRLVVGVEQVEYSHYLMGRAYEARGENAMAIDHFRQSPSIPEAGKNLTRLTTPAPQPPRSTK
jgi:tetratricopeptide (TPR) repeat protein